MTNEEKLESKSEIEVLKSASYVRCFCPHCQKTYNAGDKVIFGVVNPEGEHGLVTLSPYLNDFSRESTISLPEGEVVNDLLCPICKKSLIIAGKKCEQCGAQAAMIIIQVSERKLPFYICPRVNCHWHDIDEVHKEFIHLDESSEW